MEDNKIYVFVCAKYRTSEHSGTYAISKDANWDDLIDHITNEMKLPRASITCINEISKELYEHLHQEN